MMTIPIISIITIAPIFVQIHIRSEFTLHTTICLCMCVWVYVRRVEIELKTHKPCNAHHLLTHLYTPGDR